MRPLAVRAGSDVDERRGRARSRATSGAFVVLAAIALSCGGHAIDGDALGAGADVPGARDGAGRFAPSAPSSALPSLSEEEPAGAAAGDAQRVPLDRAPPCDENSLAPGCGAAIAPAATNASRAPLGNASAILSERCAGCHLPGGMAPSVVGPLDVTDWGLMLQQGYITDCSAERSAIVQALSDVPAAEPMRLAEEIKIVSEEIERDCSADQRRCAGDPEQPGCDSVLIERMLDQRCGVCHGQVARQSGGDLATMSYVDDLPQLIEHRRIAACQPESSSLLLSARDGSMPPSNRAGPVTGYPLNDDDIALLTKFINGLCPGDASSAPEDAEQRGIEENLQAQCGECHGALAAAPSERAGELSEVGNLDALIREGWLLPCVPDASPLIARIEDGSMPPPEASGPRPTNADVLALRQYVLRPCAGP